MSGAHGNGYGKPYRAMHLLLTTTMKLRGIISLLHE